MSEKSKPVGRCATCAFSEALGNGKAVMCRRHPPSISWWRDFFSRRKHDPRVRMAYWPVVHVDSWCGEWKAADAAAQRVDCFRAQETSAPEEGVRVA